MVKFKESFSFTGLRFILAKSLPQFGSISLLIRLSIKFMYITLKMSLDMSIFNFHLFVC